MLFASAYSDRRVLVTGHTGFKGAWLCEWLLDLGAHVTGLALPPPTEPALFEQLGLARRVRHVEADIRDISAIRRVIDETQPHFIFHLAAQSLVRQSYEQPLETYGVNVMGTAVVLEAVRLAKIPCVVVCVTTDKCYENREWEYSYREEDPLGGHDPYSSSKGGAELVIAAYRRSFFSLGEASVRLASARAGNVIGGGDWAMDRILPDCIRSLARGEAIPVRNKVATRPWQHVLEPLSGYLWLGTCLADSRRAAPSRDVASAFNFGPTLESNRTVAELVLEVLKHWPGRWEDRSSPDAVHEAQRLNLATDKAYHVLGWGPAWSFPEAVKRTVDWYQEAFKTEADMPSLTLGQIRDYTASACAAGRVWAQPVAADLPL